MFCISYLAVFCVAESFKFFFQSFICVQGFKCSLADVAPVTGEQWSPLLRDHLRPLQDALFRMEVISLEGDVYKVVLYLVKESNDICINGLLVKEGFARSTGDR